MIEQAEYQMKLPGRDVSERLQVFFSELRDALDPDTEDSFSASCGKRNCNAVAASPRIERGTISKIFQEPRAVRFATPVAAP